MAQKKAKTKVPARKCFHNGIPVIVNCFQNVLDVNLENLLFISKLGRKLGNSTLKYLKLKFDI